MNIKSYMKKIKYYLRYLFIPDDKYVSYKFKKYFGYKLDLEHPKTLNEKIQWLKINDRSNLHTICADKFLVRAYVKDKIGEEYLIPLVFETFNAYDINKETLPSYPVVVKVNHSRGVFLIKNRQDINYEEIQNKLKDELKNNFYYRTREWQYKNIRPRILVEKMLLDDKNEIPYDYKFHCFNGNIELIQVDINRFLRHKRNLYNIKWEKQEFNWLWQSEGNLQKPKTLDKMIHLAKKLSENFIFSRIDLYTIGTQIYFGEITFHPGSGFEKFDPFSIDKVLGNKLKLPKKVLH